MLLLFFFFQAEDGIRDLTVTGVQTCALPIYNEFRGVRWPQGSSLGTRSSCIIPRSTYTSELVISLSTTRSTTGPCRRCRSEERRVGKECRSRWSRVHQKKSQLKI